jgi:AcrR family transcriptional regulator
MKGAADCDAGVRRCGRPRREEAARRHEHLLEVATQLFMAHGYEGASMGAVAEAAGAGKATLYRRYKDKKELFEAVLTARINEWLLPLVQAAEDQDNGASSGDLEEILNDLSRAILRQARNPRFGALRRVIAAQSAQFPELAEKAYRQGWLRAVDTVASTLRAVALRQDLAIPNEKLAAEMLLNLILAPLSRAALYGVELDADDLEARRAAAVRLFRAGNMAAIAEAY